MNRPDWPSTTQRKSQIFADLEVKSDDPRIEICSSALQATHGSHGVLILTEWDEFREIDFAKVYENMHKPAWIFDGRNVLTWRS